MHRLSIKQMSEKLQAREITSVALTQHYLDRIEKYDGDLNAYITVTPELAIEMAKKADEMLDKGEGSLLTGIPVAHKDIFCIDGVKTSCGSKMLHNFVAPYDATVVEKLKAVGMPILGKTNMDEFAMGSSSESSYYGPTKNPWRLNAVPGGSSGGSAAVIAAGLAPLATGTDTGGSIRQPASFCGITGIKPTYGAVSRYGMIAYASSFDQGGPMSRSAEDAAWLLDAMSGFDAKDSTSLEQEKPDYTTRLAESLKGLRVGVPKEYFGEGLDASVSDVTKAAIEVLRQQGADIVEVSLPNKDLAVPAYYVLAPAEASSNLSRFDGVRYGHRCENPKDLSDLYMRSRSEGFGAEVKRRIMVGAYALSEGYYDAYYLKAQKLRRMVRDDFIKAFEQCDVIVGPVAPTPAFNIGEKSDDPISMYLADLYTIPVNLAGLPAMSIPAGFSEGLPVGLHLIGTYHSEGKLLNVAHQFQQVTSWHEQMPEAYQ
ncbi:Asp-tRNA(Asn)/Glu-tRNA(Gln) amidotransferase subunit GatA [Hydrogenovibrio marinus]|uniref:Glutamyl-tRNA(Gln) amidotransferase subunit A n=1 Tax=Hydrogenovibrio marinus TaxID=28885 RepID=A0A066ZRV3_HYDMR|nr:Asp-tRNA(Asn)/Glu-tRNA(Gln) amidotransferase subunit GatA [Hydrogenovibrio marinus]KDN96543.1 glutamyl-tRNA amidotransferase [Hydrogenovibrio marinus]BBN60251.1 glutamyl-tRNA(Gln) amidotransferase subunit A [Hydrogenovibrio marinus]